MIQKLNVFFHVFILLLILSIISLFVQSHVSAAENTSTPTCSNCVRGTKYSSNSLSCKAKKGICAKFNNSPKKGTKCVVSDYSKIGSVITGLCPGNSTIVCCAGIIDSKITPTPISNQTPTVVPTKTETLTPTNTISPTATPIPTKVPTSLPKIIFIGDSRVVLLAGKGGKYKMNYRNRDVVFIAEGGTRYSHWFNSGSKYMKKVDDVIAKYPNQKCAIVVGLAGNDLNHSTASSASKGRQKIIDLTVKYKNSLVILANKYSNQCTVYFTSVNPVQLNKKVTVYSYTSSKALTKTGRSNAKIDVFNNSLKSLIESINLSNLKYIDTSSYFVESKDKLKNGYNTYDGTHYDAKTSQLVFDKIIELAGL